MIVIVQVKLQPTPDQFRALAKTLAACNEAACRASQIAFEAGGATGRRKIRRPQLQELAYHEATSDGTLYSGGLLTGIRKRQLRLRKKLQAKGTKSARRLLKARSCKEGRFAADLNHQISKKIVTEAVRTGRGIAVEELTGIRERARLRKPQRVALNSWAFAQLGSFIAYKAERSGVPLVKVDPACTSQTCSSCGNVDKASRISQATYICRACGVVANADVNAAVNIAARAVDSWAAVRQPYAAFT